MAVEKGQRKVVKSLLDKGAEVDGVANGKTPLERAATSGHLAVCQVLIGAGATVDARVFGTEEGDSATIEMILRFELSPGAP